MHVHVQVMLHCCIVYVCHLLQMIALCVFTTSLLTLRPLFTAQMGKIFNIKMANGFGASTETSGHKLWAGVDTEEGGGFMGLQPPTPVPPFCKIVANFVCTRTQHIILILKIISTQSYKNLGDIDWSARTAATPSFWKFSGSAPVWAGLCWQTPGARQGNHLWCGSTLHFQLAARTHN